MAGDFPVKIGNVIRGHIQIQLTVIVIGCGKRNDGFQAGPLVFCGVDVRISVMGVLYAYGHIEYLYAFGFDLNMTPDWSCPRIILIDGTAALYAAE